MATFTKTGKGALGELPNVFSKTGKGTSTFIGSGAKPDTRPPMTGPVTIPVALAYPLIAGVNLPAVPNAYDAAELATVIQMVITDYNNPHEGTKMGNASTLPLSNGDTAYGGVAVLYPTRELLKITMGGYIDTPMVMSGSWRLPDVVHVPTGQRMTYAEFIITCLEGRFYSPWQTIHPLWFRDPFHRVYTNVKVFDFNASYVEGTPGRTNFQMTLVI